MKSLSDACTLINQQILNHDGLTLEVIKSPDEDSFIVDKYESNTGYQVGIEPIEVKRDNIITPVDLLYYLKRFDQIKSRRKTKNNDLTYHLGFFWHKEDKRLYVDVSAKVDTISYAMKIGAYNHEQYVWDWSNKQVLAVSEVN